MKIQEWLDSLRRGRTWEEVGGRKLPYVTIVLKYVFGFFFLSFFHSLFFPSLLFNCLQFAEWISQELRKRTLGEIEDEENVLMTVSQSWL
jgi:hypothetical protein